MSFINLKTRYLQWCSETGWMCHSGFMMLVMQYLRYLASFASPATKNYLLGHLRYFTSLSPLPIPCCNRTAKSSLSALAQRHPLHKFARRQPLQVLMDMIQKGRTSVAHVQRHVPHFAWVTINVTRFWPSGIPIVHKKSQKHCFILFSCTSISETNRTHDTVHSHHTMSITTGLVLPIVRLDFGGPEKGGPKTMGGARPSKELCIRSQMKRPTCSPSTCSHPLELSKAYLWASPFKDQAPAFWRIMPL